MDADRMLDHVEEYDPGEVVWKLVDGFDHYLISEYGEVYSTRYDKLLTPSLVNGYYHVGLSQRSHGLHWPEKRYSGSVHRLVAFNFVPGQTEERNVVNHKDSNKLNNH